MVIFSFYLPFYMYLLTLVHSVYPDQAIFSVIAIANSEGLPCARLCTEGFSGLISFNPTASLQSSITRPISELIHRRTEHFAKQHRLQGASPEANLKPQPMVFLLPHAAIAFLKSHLMIDQVRQVALGSEGLVVKCGFWSRELWVYQGWNIAGPQTKSSLPTCLGTYLITVTAQQISLVYLDFQLLFKN